MAGTNQPSVKPARSAGAACGSWIVVRRWLVGEKMVGGRELAAPVDPVLRRQVAHPPVPGADVVEDHVHHQADAARAGVAGEGAHVLVAAHPRVHAVQVGDRVAMVGMARLVVLQHRRRPQLGEAERGDVVEVPAQAGDVAAVAAVGIGAVRGLAQAGDAVVARVAVGEAVGHHQVDRIGGIEAAALRRARHARIESPVAGGHGASVGLERDRHHAGRGVRRDVHGDEQVVRVVGALHVDHRHPGPVDARRRAGDPGAMHHQLHPVVAHAHPPVAGFQVFDHRGARGGGDGEPQQAAGEQEAHGRPR